VLAVGLTGGIASGKSLAADAFIALGVPVLNADVVAREVVAAGTPALAAIRDRFGGAFLLPDGTLDRRRLREHVFANPAERVALERITHPAIRARLLAWRDAQTAPYCVLDVPILVESGMDSLVDRILVIDAPAEMQVERLVRRDHVTEALARQMLAAQASREARLSRADDVIRNQGSVGDVRAAVGQLHPWYLELGRTGEKPRSGRHLP
jgi:dephospho-CoA kinase